MNKKASMITIYILTGHVHHISCFFNKIKKSHKLTLPMMIMITKIMMIMIMKIMMTMVMKIMVMKIMMTMVMKIMMTMVISTPSQYLINLLFKHINFLSVSPYHRVSIKNLANTGYNILLNEKNPRSNRLALRTWRVSKDVKANALSACSNLLSII